MPNTYKLTHSFQGMGGTTEDQYVNQFYFFAEDHPPELVNTTTAETGFAWGPLLAATVHALWVVPVGGQSLSKFYAARCTGNLGVTKIYDVTGNPPLAGPPIFTIADSTLIPADDYLSEATGTSPQLPEEVAICLSYQAIHTGGDLPRRRGRIYLGPFTTDVINDNGDRFGPCHVSNVVRDVILGAAQIMQSECAASDFEWRVFSTMDGAAFKIVQFFVDDAFDTVRGRGGAPSVRDSLPIL